LQLDVFLQITLELRGKINRKAVQLRPLVFDNNIVAAIGNIDESISPVTLNSLPSHGVPKFIEEGEIERNWLIGAALALLDLYIAIHSVPGAGGRGSSAALAQGMTKKSKKQ
jgi:hypothetical protein